MEEVYFHCRFMPCLVAHRWRKAVIGNAAQPIDLNLVNAKGKVERRCGGGELKIRGRVADLSAKPFTLKPET